MFSIRQSMRSDAEQILKVARHLDTVNLPANASHIERILELSEQSFTGSVPDAEREYLFVLTDDESNADGVSNSGGERVIGTSMIHAQHGSRRAPHVYFQILKDERYSESLDRYFVHQCLRIGYDYDGPTEIGGLILLPEYRRNGASLGKMLSYVRFLFIAMHRDVFRDHVLSELLPPLGDDGSSVLWDHLGRRFTGLDYQEADLLSKNNKEFIKSLFPHSLIYTALLPQDVQDAIGVVGPATRGVEKILKRIGFENANQIDPFDGGPHFTAETDNISLVRDSRKRRVSRAGDDRTTGAWTLVAAEPTPTSMRAIVVNGDMHAQTIAIGEQHRARLGVEIDDDVWTVTA